MSCYQIGNPLPHLDLSLRRYNFMQKVLRNRELICQENSRFGKHATTSYKQAIIGWESFSLFADVT